MSELYTHGDRPLTHYERYVCHNCTYAAAEIERLRKIIAEQDREKLRTQQQRAAWLEEMTTQLQRWTEAQNDLIAGR